MPATTGRALMTLALGLSLLGCARHPPATERVVKIVARRFAFAPSRIVLKKGAPVVLELTSADRAHGFSAPALGAQADLAPGATVQLRLVPAQTGTFPFHCHVFCGEGHEEMTGEIVVEP